MYICRFYVRNKFKISCNSKHYEKNYLYLCEKYGTANIRVEKMAIGRRFDSKLNTIIKQVREIRE